jgi:hypothetical protein
MTLYTLVFQMCLSCPVTGLDYSGDSATQVIFGSLDGMFEIYLLATGARLDSHCLWQATNRASRHEFFTTMDYLKV